MAEETEENPQDDRLEEQPVEETTGTPFDQSSIDAMVESAQGSQADELESLLEDLGDEDTDDAELSDADQLEDLVENLESGGVEENLDDIVYQATLQDAAESQDAGSENQESAAGETDALASENDEETTENELDELDALVAAFDDDEDVTPVVEEVVETELSVSEAEDLDSLLSGLDGEQDEETVLEEVDPEETDAAGLTESLESGEESTALEAEEDLDLGSLLEDLDSEEESSAEEEQDDEVEDVEALLEDLDEPSVADTTDEDGAGDLESLLDDLDEVAVEDAVDGEEVENVESLLEDLDVSEDVEELIEDLDEPADGAVSEGDDNTALEADEETDDVGALLEDLNESAEIVEEVDGDSESLEAEADVTSLLEDLDEPDDPEDVGIEDLLEDLADEPLAIEAEGDTPGEVEEVTELQVESSDDTELEAEDEVEDLESLLEDLEDSGEEETEESGGVVEPSEEASVLEAEEEMDVESLLDDLETEDDAVEDIELPEDDEPAPEGIEDQDAINALVESGADDETLESTEGEASEDLGSLLEDLEEDKEETAEIEEPETESEASGDLGSLLEDLEEDAENTTEPEALESAEDIDLEDLVTDDADGELSAEDMPVDLEDTLAEDATLDDLDLDDLDLDDDSLPDLDLDDDDTAGLEDLEEESSDLDCILDELDEGVELEVDSVSAEDDLDSLFDDDDPILEDEILESDLNVGVEHEVAHMLATGQPGPTQEGEDLFEDFASVQASLIGETDEESGGTILIVDDDEDNIGLFQDTLVEGDYEFLGTNTAEEALNIIQTQDVDLVIVNLDTADQEGVKTVSLMADGDVLPVPLVVTSEQDELIEGALLAGADDHFTRPIGIVDLEYQVPRTVSNLIKLKRSQHVLTSVGTGGSSARDAPPPPPSSESLDDLLDDEDDDFQIDDDDLLAEDDDPGPSARLAGGTGSAGDRLYPLTDQSKLIREKEWAQARKPVSNLPMYLGIGLMMILLAGLSGLATMYVMDMKQQEIANKAVIQRPLPVPVLKPPKVQ